MNELWLHLALAGAGIVAGFLNTLAGGGSLLTLPALMLLGLPADLANGTNRLSVLSQSAAGMLGFRSHGKLDSGALVPVVTPTVIGAAIGAATAAHVPAPVLKYVLLGSMMTMAVVITAFPGLITAPVDSEPRFASRRLAATLGLFAVGLYGGFVQAGVGFLLLGVLCGVIRYDLVRANALKLACVAVYGIVALAIYAWAGQVSWLIGALLAVYTIIGAKIAVRFALRANQRGLRWLVLVCVLATCVAALLKG
jgi:uncharacterized protein